MPIYGEAKQRNMIRSVLPSTHRKGARDDIACAKRRSRSRVNQSLRAYRGAASEVIDNYDEWGDDLTVYPDREISDVVWDRRAADKTHPLERWAAAQVEDVPMEDRMSKIRAILPDNTIGRHAAQHVEYSDAFYIPHSDRFLFRYEMRYRWTAAEREWYNNANVAVFVERLHRLLEHPGAHKRFNDTEATRKIKKRVVPAAEVVESPLGHRFFHNGTSVGYDHRRREWFYHEIVRRPLLGYHDIDDFLNEFNVPGAMVHWTKAGGSKWDHLDRILRELGV